MRISDWSSDVCSSDLPRLPSALDLVDQGLCWIWAGHVPVHRLAERHRWNPLLGRETQVRHPVLRDRDRRAPVRRRSASALRSEEHTSELQSLMRLSYAVFCLNKNKNKQQQNIQTT